KDRSNPQDIRQDQKEEEIREKKGAPDTGYPSHFQMKREEIFQTNRSSDKNTPDLVDNTMERLQAAVKKEPDPNLYDRKTVVSGRKTMSSSSKGTLNSILKRISGFREKKQQVAKDAEVSPSLHGRMPVVEEQKVVSDTGKTTYTNDQKHKEEVPAFLRRQAN
ncbi:MAG: hypothetical protein VYA61_02190, partial [Pseudomonadota bacterium]|nr:hypothetical protein [Pseudomonadota bacterium]